MPRGRLIFPFVAELHRLDVQAMAALDPDGPGPLVSGIDPDFKESVLMESGDTTTPLRLEQPPVRVPCQVEPQAFEAMALFPAGNSPRSAFTLVFHFKDLERLELVDEQTGEALICPGDRLGALYALDGQLVQTIVNPPGAFVEEALPIGFGIGRGIPRRNLLLVSFESRQQAARGLG